MFFKDQSKEDFKKQLYSIKRYINTLEKKYDITQTSIIEVDSDYTKIRAFVITAPKVYIQSPGLHHGLVAMMRTMHKTSTNITATNVAKVLDTIQYKDTRVLRHMIKYKVFELLLKNHKEIIKSVSLLGAYPKYVDNVKANTYHSGFGMVAICSHRMASKAYSNAVLKILKREKIPVYN